MIAARRRAVPGGKSRAFTLIEFLIASFLTLLVLGAAAVGTTGAQKALRTATDTYTASRIAANVLDKARALGCGEDTDPTYILSGRSGSCGNAITKASLTYSGDMKFTEDLGVVDGRTVQADVEYTTSWQPLGWKPSAAERCNPKSSAKYTSDIATGGVANWVTPPVLERRVTVTLRSTSTSPVQRSWRQLSAAPERALTLNANPNAATATLGALLVTNLAGGDNVTLTGGSGGTILRRVPSGCVSASLLFPYLPEGTYDVTKNSGTTSGAAVQRAVVAGVVTEVS